MAKVHKNIHLTKRRGMNLYCQHVCLPIGQGTVLHRVLTGRRTLHPDARMPHAPRRRQNTFRHLRMLD